MFFPVLFFNDYIFFFGDLIRERKREIERLLALSHTLSLVYSKVKWIKKITSNKNKNKKNLSRSHRCTAMCPLHTTDLIRCKKNAKIKKNDSQQCSYLLWSHVNTFFKSKKYYFLRAKYKIKTNSTGIQQFAHLHWFRESCAAAPLPLPCASVSISPLPTAHMYHVNYSFLCK